MSDIWEDVEDFEKIVKWREEEVEFIDDTKLPRWLICELLEYTADIGEDRNDNIAETVEKLEKYYDMCPRCICPTGYCSGHC